MERRFEYGGYAVLARAVPAGQGYLGLAVIADAFGEEASVPTHSQEVGVAPTAEAALAWPRRRRCAPSTRARWSDDAGIVAGGWQKKRPGSGCALAGR